MKQVYINTLDIPSIQRFAVGFDRMFDELSRTAGTLNASNYPPYNIIKESETIWKIEVEDFPAFILVDNKGNDFFKQIKPRCTGNCK